MGSKGVELTFTANAKQLLRTTGDVDKAFNEVADSLDDIAKTSGNVTDDMASDFKQAGTKVERSAEDIERSFADMANEVGQSSAKAGDALAANTKRGTDKAKGNLDELKDEAKANIAETASSFDGSISSLGDTVQGTLGGVIAALPPQFAIAAGLAAVGLGVITSEFERLEERKQKDREDTAELAGEYIDLGRAGSRSVANIAAELRNMATTTDDNEVKLGDLKKTADQLGIPFDSLAQAYAGNSDLLDAQIAKVRELYVEQQAVDAAATQGANSYSANVSENQIALAKQIGLLTEAKAKADEAAAAQKLYAESGASELANKAAVIQTVNDAYDEQAGNIEKFLGKESGLFNTDKYIAAMERRSKALADYQADLAKSDLSPEAKAFLNEQGAEAAASFLAGYEKASPKQREKLNNIWTEAAKSDSGAYRDEAQKGLNAKPLDAPKVKTPELDTTAFLRAAQRNLDASPLKVTVEYRDRTGKEIK